VVRFLPDLVCAYVEAVLLVFTVVCFDTCIFPSKMGANSRLANSVSVFATFFALLNSNIENQTQV
jgi:hypothetical protein